MISRRVFLAAIALLAVPAIAETSNPTERRILFIGNSYTAYNGGLPKIIRQMAADAGKSIDTEGSLAGGKSLEYHWNEGKARQVIESAKWDFVVLQDFSTQATSKPAVMQDYATKFAEFVKKHGGKPVLYMTWARQHQPENQSIIATAYRKAADASGATVAPVGLAWQRVLRERKDIPLYFEDKSHPNPAGTYLTACVFYQVLLGATPTDKVPAIYNQRTKEMDELPPDVASYLRKVAAETVASKRTDQS